MNPTLNSPKYAAPESLDYRLHKIQQERKNRKKFVPQLEQRYFRRNEGSTDYATIPEVTLAGDFVIEVTVYISSEVNDGFVFSGGTAGGGLELYKDGGGNHGRLALFYNGVKSDNTPVLTTDVFHDLTIERVGSVIALKDSLGSTLTSITAAGSCVINTLYARLNSSSFNLSGILANLKIYDNGTLIRDYPLNDNSNILANRAASLGADAFSGFSTLGDGCSDEGGGLYSWDGTQTGDSYSVKPLGVVYGSTQLITFTAEVVSGAVGPSMGVGGARVSETGTYTQLIPATNTTNISFGANDSFVGSVSNITIRQADGYGTIINGNADDWGLFDKQANGDWLGQELVVNGGFDTDSAWAFSGASIADGMLVFGTGTTYADQVNLITGNLYQFRFDVVDYNGASIGLSSLTINPSYLVSAVGSYMVEDNAVNNYVRLVSTGSDLNAIDNVSVKEVLKNA